MNLADIARQLSYGELSQISFGRELSTSPTLERVSQLADNVNLALTSIYKRFNLKEDRLSVTLSPTVFIYPLNSANLLKVEQVQTVSGEVLGLNDASDPYSCSTPSTKQLRVPEDVAKQGRDLPEKYKTTGLWVVFRANHPRIPAQTAFTSGMHTIELELPDAYLQALLYFAASRVHNPVGMVNEFNAGNNFFAKYEAECRRLELENMGVDLGGGNTKFSQKGFP